MANDEYRTSPDHENTGWPPGVPYIVGNEGCERFSFYGMKAILFVHLASLYVLAGYVEEQAKDVATSTTHLFIAGVYAFPMIGAILADRLLGKYKTILWLSLVYCAGHGVLAVGENSLTGMYLGLALIAIGSGGIKPCVSANVGDQFGRSNWFRVRTIFQIFYFSINFGSAFATIIIPRTREYLGTSVAFAIPGILMGIATVVFWLGRKKFVHVPPKPGGKLGLLDALSSIFLFMALGQLFFTSSMAWWVIVLVGAASFAIGLVLFVVRQKLQPDDGFLAIMLTTLWDHISGKKAAQSSAVGANGSNVGVPSVEEPKEPDEVVKAPLARYAFWRPAVARFGQEATEGPVAVLKIISIFFLVSVFWALFDQHSSSWIRQAEMMDRTFTLPLIGEMTLLPSELPALNPFMVMALIPLMNVLYNLSDKLGFAPTPLRRMTVGMLLTSASFVAVALIQTSIVANGEGTVAVAWQVLPYLIITASEVMVSITGLEFAYTQAPKRMKSTILGFWMLTVSVGNILVAVIAHIPELSLVSFFWLFAGLMAVAGLGFGARAYFYTPKDYPQD